ncbi:MAG: DUF302 domain-containing protein [bacterium]|nr:DUF302 domain-containing protein [bacterium]
MKTQTSYGYSAEVNLDFDAAVQKVTELLKDEGFSILTTIDVKAKMKEKLNKNMDEYVILGACNPAMAAKALEAEKEIGLLLPCNVIVYIKGNKTIVSAVMPNALMSSIGNKALCAVAKTVEEKLKSVIDRM